MEPQQVEGYQRKKGQLQQAIEERRHQIEQLKAQRKALPKHIEIKDLPEQDRFNRLCSEKKHFIDTIKLIAYRAETALAQLAREKIKRLDDARSLIRQLFRTEVDLIPDQQNKTLTVRLHPMSTQAHDEIVRYICVEITTTETVFPGPIYASFTKSPAHPNSIGTGGLRLRSLRAIVPLIANWASFWAGGVVPPGTGVPLSLEPLLRVLPCIRFV
jgi:hypothetical protein